MVFTRGLVCSVVALRRTYQEFERTVRNHENFTGVLPGLTDLDGMCERRKRFLFLEGKECSSNDEVYVPLGQWIALKELAELSERVTVMLVAERTKASKHTTQAYAVIDIQDLDKRGHREVMQAGRRTVVLRVNSKWKNVTLNGLRALCAKWEKEAKGG